MSFTERIKSASRDVHRVIWIIAVPILIDMASLLIYIYFLKGQALAINKFFILKLGVISAPPSISYLIDNYPTMLFSFNTSYGAWGLIMTVSVFNILLALSISLVQSFLKSGYMGCLEAAGGERVKPLEFFSLANKNWFKYFMLQLINCIFLFMIIKNSTFIIAAILVSIMLFYTQYAIVVDGGSLINNIKKSLHILGNNLGKTIQAAICFGFFMSLTSPLVFSISNFGYAGIIIAIVIVNYFGMWINKAVLELYRDMSNEELSVCEAETIH